MSTSSKGTGETDIEILGASDDPAEEVQPGTGRLAWRMGFRRLLFPPVSFLYLIVYEADG